MVRECENCGRIIRGAGRKYCSYCRNSVEVRNKREEDYFPEDLDYYPQKKELNWKPFFVFLIIGLVVLSFFILSNKENNDLNVLENSTNTPCQYKAQQDTGKTISYLRDDEGNKYENPVQAGDFSGQSTGSIFIGSCTTTFILKNTLDKAIPLEISYIHTYNQDGKVTLTPKSLDLTLSPFENYVISETIEKIAPAQSCSVNPDSINIIYQSNSQLELVSEKIYEEVCKKCNNEICLNNGEKCNNDSECGSGVCNIAEVCGTQKIVECSEGFRNCNNESCLEVGVKKVEEKYSCEFECKTGYGKEGICKVSIKEKISKSVFTLLFLLISALIIYIILSEKKLMEIIRR